MNTPNTERRQHLAVRAIFEEACSLTQDFFTPSNGWAGKPLTLLAFRALREHYPDLNDQDFAILCSGVENYHLHRKPH